MQVVRLSKRNLLTLLAKLEIHGDPRSILKGDGTVVIAEPDEIHYRNHTPGPMKPETERLVSIFDAALKENPPCH
jgi:hypothetical protein